MLVVRLTRQPVGPGFSRPASSTETGVPIRDVHGGASVFLRFGAAFEALPGAARQKKRRIKMKKMKRKKTKSRMKIRRMRRVAGPSPTGGSSYS
jgi:hypothetical protein